MSDQWLAPASADLLSQPYPAHQFVRNGMIFSLSDTAGHAFVFPDIENLVEAPPYPAHVGWERGDVLAP